MDVAIECCTWLSKEMKPYFCRFSMWKNSIVCCKLITNPKYCQVTHTCCKWNLSEPNINIFLIHKIHNETKDWHLYVKCTLYICIFSSFNKHWLEIQRKQQYWMQKDNLSNCLKTKLVLICNKLHVNAMTILFFSTWCFSGLQKPSEDKIHHLPCML